MNELFIYIKQQLQSWKDEYKDFNLDPIKIFVDKKTYSEYNLKEQADKEIRILEDNLKDNGLLNDVCKFISESGKNTKFFSLKVLK
jgi:hypothetical protein